MTTEIVHVRNLETGAVGQTSRRLFEHAFFNPGLLVEVDEDAKPYVEGMYKSKVQSDDELDFPTDEEESDTTDEKDAD